MRSLEDLIPKIRQATDDKKLHWEINGSGFGCKLAKQYIRVWTWHDGDADASGVTVQLLTGPGFGDTLLDSVTAGDYDSNYNELTNLHSAARRSALNVDKVISNLSDELDKL